MESPASSSEAPVVSSCRRKKNFGSGSFVSDLRAHVHEFLHASVDEHRICLVDTFKKMKSKIYRERVLLAQMKEKLHCLYKTRTE